MANKPEATVDNILMGISVLTDAWMRRLADAIERRNIGALISLTETTYIYTNLLKILERDLEIPGEWPDRIEGLFGEFQHLRVLAMELVRQNKG